MSDWRFENLWEEVISMVTVMHVALERVYAPVLGSMHRSITVDSFLGSHYCVPLRDVSPGLSHF